MIEKADMMVVWKDSCSAALLVASKVVSKADHLVDVKVEKRVGRSVGCLVELSAAKWVVLTD